MLAVMTCKLYGSPTRFLTHADFFLETWLDSYCFRDGYCQGAEKAVCFIQRCLCTPGFYYSEGQKTCVKGVYVLVFAYSVFFFSLCVFASVCACVRARARVCVCVRTCVCACVRACVRGFLS